MVRLNFIGYNDDSVAEIILNFYCISSVNFSCFSNLEVFQVFDIASKTIHDSWRNSNQPFTKFL